MKNGPEIAGIAALIGDPARANMLTALLSGEALTASELAVEAGVTKQTASSHLSKLLDARFITDSRQGRHRYFKLADAEIAGFLESMMSLAARRAPRRFRPGPKEPALRKARVCYDHLAGEMGVALYDGLLGRGWLVEDGPGIIVTEAGRHRLAGMEIDFAAMGRRRRPICLACLDWSMRRNHLAGALGAALLRRFYHLGWARRVDGSRVVEFSKRGLSEFNKQFC